jgi:hypothetical protein
MIGIARLTWLSGSGEDGIMREIANAPIYFTALLGERSWLKGFDTVDEQYNQRQLKHDREGREIPDDEAEVLVDSNERMQ